MYHFKTVEHPAGIAFAQARAAIQRASRNISPSQAALSSVRRALQSLRGRLNGRVVSQPCVVGDDVIERKLAKLSIAAIALECCALRPDVDPLITEIGCTELRRAIYETHLQVLGTQVSTDLQVAGDYYSAVGACALCENLRDRLARNLQISERS